MSATPESALPAEIRGVMLPVTRGYVLVPNTLMAEVITFAHPAPVAGAPAWLLGRLGWRGWRLPVLAFSVFTDVVEHEPTDSTRVAILKALGGHPRLPYFGVLTQGFPRLTLIAPDTLADAKPTDLSGVKQEVRVREDAAWIPDLAYIEDRLLGALPVAA